MIKNKAYSLIREHITCNQNVMIQVTKDVAEISQELYDKLLLIAEGEQYLRLVKQYELVKIYQISSKYVDLPEISSVFTMQEINKANDKYFGYTIDGIVNKLKDVGVQYYLHEKATFIHEQYVPRQDASAWNDVINKFGQFAKEEDAAGCPIREMRSENFIKILSNYGSNSSPVIKSILTKYMQWLEKNGIVTNDDVNVIRDVSIADIDFSDFFKKNYFFSLDEVVDIINKSSMPKDYINYFLVPISVLSWYGVDIRRIINLDGNNFNFITKEVIISEKEKYQLSDDDFVLATKVFIAFKGAEQKFIDTEIINNNKKEIIPFVRRIFFEMNDGANKIANIRYIYESGRYRNVYNKEQEIGVNPLLSDRSFVYSLYKNKKINPSDVSKINRGYANWKKAFVK